MTVRPPDSPSESFWDKGGFSERETLKAGIDRLLKPQQDQAEQLIAHLASAVSHFGQDSEALKSFLQEQQETIDGLFEEKSADILNYLSTRLPPSEVEPFLQSLKQEWKETYNVEASAGSPKKKTLRSPEQLFKDQAGAKTRQKQADSSSSQGQGGAAAQNSDFNTLWQDFLAAYKNQQLPAQPKPDNYPGLKESLKAWSTATGERKQQLFQKITTLISGGMTPSPKPNPDGTFGPQKSALPPFPEEPSSTQATHKRSFKAAFTKKPTFEKTAPAMLPLDPYKTAIQKWNQYQPGSPDYQFAVAITAEIDALEASDPNSSISALDDWITNTLFQPDIYYKFPGLSDGAINSLNRYASLGVAAPTPSYTDKIVMAIPDYYSPSDGGVFQVILNKLLSEGPAWNSIGQVQNWLQTAIFPTFWTAYPNFSGDDAAEFTSLTGLSVPGIALQECKLNSQFWQRHYVSGSPQNKVAQAILNEIVALQTSDPATPVSALQNWIQNNLEQPDVYFSFPGLTDTNLNSLFTTAALNITAPVPTPLDRALFEAVNYQSSTQQGAALFQTIVGQIERQGPGGSIAGLQTWIQTNLFPVFWSSYPNLSVQDKTEFTLVTGLNPPPLPLDQYKTAVQTWQNQYAAGSPQSQIAQAIINEINALESSNPAAPLSALQNWIQNSLEQPDIYFSFPGLSDTDLNNLFTTAALNMVAPPPTDLDKALFEAVNYQSSTQQGAALFQTIVTEIQAQGPRGSIAGLQTWIQTNLFPVFWNSYPNLSAADVAEFKLVTGLDVPPTPLGQIDQEITNYIGPLQGLINLVIALQANHSLGPNFPTDPTQWTTANWNFLKNELNGIYTKYNTYYQMGNWAQCQLLCRGIPITNQAQALNVLNLFKSSLGDLNLYSTPRGFNSALNLFSAALAEIKILEKQRGTLAQLAAWAQSINLASYPELTSQDLTEWTKLTNL